MAIIDRHRPFWGSKEQTRVVEVGREVTLGLNTQAAFPTPNLAEVTRRGVPGSLLYLREAIDFRGRDLGRVVGRNHRYQWKPSPAEIDAPYVDRERRLTNHPYVGREFAALVGERVRMVDMGLVNKGSVPYYQLGGHPNYFSRFVHTTNERWTPVRVKNGLARNVYGQDPTNPRLEITVLDGPYTGSSLKKTEKDLKAIDQVEDAQGKVVPPSWGTALVSPESLETLIDKARRVEGGNFSGRFTVQETEEGLYVAGVLVEGPGLNPAPSTPKRDPWPWFI